MKYIGNAMKHVVFFFCNSNSICINDCGKKKNDQ